MMRTDKERAALALRVIEADGPTYPEDIEAGVEASDGATARQFLLIEHGVERYAGRRWYSTWDTPADAMRHSDDQECAEDWFAYAIVDLDTAELVEVRRHYTVIGHTELDLDNLGPCAGDL